MGKFRRQSIEDFLKEYLKKSAKDIPGEFSGEFLEGIHRVILEEIHKRFSGNVFGEISAGMTL